MVGSRRVRVSRLKTEVNCEGGYVVSVGDDIGREMEGGKMRRRKGRERSWRSS